MKRLNGINLAAAVPRQQKCPNHRPTLVAVLRFLLLESFQLSESGPQARGEGDDSRRDFGELGRDGLAWQIATNYRWRHELLITRSQAF